MTYRVEYTEEFNSQLDAQAAYLTGRHVSGQTVDNWFARLFEAVESLDDWPRRYPVSESESDVVGHEVRKMNFGDYLIFYSVDDDRRIVRVHRFRHGARRR